MDSLLAAEINRFGPEPKADVSPSEDPIFVLTSGQLQDIISRAIQPLQDEIMELRGEGGDKDRDEMAALRSKTDILERFVCAHLGDMPKTEEFEEMLDLYRRRRKGLEDRLTRILSIEDALEYDIIPAINKQAEILNKRAKTSRTEKTSQHLDKLAAHLMKKGEAKRFPAIGFKEASQLLGITKRRVSQLQPTIKADGRFIIQTHGKTLYIQLR